MSRVRVPRIELVMCAHENVNVRTNQNSCAHMKKRMCTQTEMKGLRVRPGRGFYRLRLIQWCTRTPVFGRMCVRAMVYFDTSDANASGGVLCPRVVAFLELAPQPGRRCTLPPGESPGFNPRPTNRRPPLKNLPLDYWPETPLECWSQNAHFHGRSSSHPERQPAPGQRARYGGGHRGEITPQNASCGDPFHGQNRDPLRACPTPGSHNLRDCRPAGLPPQRPGFPWRPRHPPRSACPTQQRLAQRRACIGYGTRACRPFAPDTRLHMDAAQDMDRIVGPCACPTKRRLAQRRACITYRTRACRPFARDARLNMDAAQDVDRSGGASACPTPGSHNLRDCRPVGLPPQRPGFPWRPRHPPRSACPTQQRLAQRRACITYRTRAWRPFARDNRLNVDAAQQVVPSGDIEASPRPSPLDCTLAPGAP